MKEALRYFMLWVMLFALLVSSAGFRVVQHTCNRCNVSEYFLNVPEPCCGYAYYYAVNVPDEADCCSHHYESFACTGWIDSEKCCEINSAIYLTGNVVQVHTPKVRAEVIELIQFSESCYYSMVTFEREATENVFNFKDPAPLLFAGTSFLYFIHQLKIPSA